MKKRFTFTKQLSFIAIIITICFFAISCNQPSKQTATVDKKVTISTDEKPDYYNFRPELEKEYGYTHAVKIGSHIKISGAVSMDDKGVLIAQGNLEQQMKNCYSDLEKILTHYGCTFDDVYAENIYTTDMAGLEKVLGFRNSIYKKQFPTGTWLEVKGLALPGQLIEIDMEALKAN
jgi:enamine deaminase RidA (YjgF/YER057c/UK114 family)